MTVEVNKNLSLGEKIFKNLVFDPAVKAGLTALYTNPSTSWMNIWPIKNIVDHAVYSFEDLLFTGFTLAVDVTAIKFLNGEAHDQYVKSSIDLANIANMKGENSDEYKIAMAKACADQSRFTQFHR